MITTRKNLLGRAIALAAVSTTLTLAGCGGDSSSSSDGSGEAATASSLSFEALNAPSSDFEKRLVRTSSSAEINGERISLGYKTLLRSGDSIGNETFGLLYNADGSVATSSDGSPRVSNANEFTSLLPIGDRLFSVSQFEDAPGAMYLIELAQNEETGELSAIDLMNVALDGVDGGWVHCAGSVTPWNTHLASEEYEPNARGVDPETGVSGNGRYDSAMATYKGGIENANVYDYGWNIEVEVSLDEGGEASTTTTKHYAMGRLAIELAKVMPDSKTAYITDDGTNVGFYMFVADNAGDLSAGTLYATKWNQTSAKGVGAADLEWVSLGHASDADIKTYLDNGTAFADIFETADMDAEGNCADGFTGINTATGKECLKLKPGMEKAASRMETRRYAAMMGATTEFRKEEGIALDMANKKLYVGMSEVARGMEDFAKSGSASNSYDLGGPNHIALEGFNSCGAVYELELAEDADIGSAWVAQNMTGLVAGIPAIEGMGAGEGNETVANTAEFADSNRCHIDGLANPDNVTFLEGFKTLLIGEDTGSGHQNDAVWAYNMESGELTRILTTPYGAETTSLYWFPDINGWGYMMTVAQHPYGESDQDKLPVGSEDNRAYTGYVGPIPMR